MESAELEAMDVFGDKEDEEDRWDTPGTISCLYHHRLQSHALLGKKDRHCSHHLPRDSCTTSWPNPLLPT